MTARQQQLIRESLEGVLPIADDVATLFYRRLFELDPYLRLIFRIDMRKQGRKLVAAIETAVTNLDRIETILPTIRDLGIRHSGYGVRYEHYETAGAALIWTLERSLGEKFCAATKQAWIDLYGLLAMTMQDAAGKATQFRQRVAEIERRNKYAMLQYG